MKRENSVKLWLVEGGVPHYEEMVLLGGEIVRVVLEEKGEGYLIERLSDPFWFSCLATTLGFEWNTSGQTTVTLLALKDALERLKLPVRVLGGKGLKARSVPSELEEKVRELGIEELKGEVIRGSRLACKVDQSALQDSYDVYFHTVVISSSGDWCVINQGMNVEDRTARRYHWKCEGDIGVENPHAGISSETAREVVLDMTSRESRGCRSACLEIAKDTPASALQGDFKRVKASLSGQTTLDGRLPVEVPPYLKPPNKLDASVIKRAADGASSFEEFLLKGGIGEAAVRGLAYVASLIYGAPPSWRDPVKYAYAHGTKSGRPYYVDRRRMRAGAELLRQAVEEARIGRREKLDALRRLSSWLSE